VGANAEIDHVGDRALGLAALPPADVEREAAYAHARACPECTAALEQAEKMLARLDTVVASPAPPPGVLGRTASLILDDLGTRSFRSSLLSGLLMATWLVLVLLAKKRAPGSLVLLESGLFMALAVACIGAVRHLGWGAALGAIGASATLVALAFDDGDLAPRVGRACLLLELGAAVPPFALSARLLAARGAARPPAVLFVAAAAGALAAQAALHVTCPVRTSGGHLVVFHFGGVVLAALAAAAASGRGRRGGMTTGASGPGSTTVAAAG